MLKSDSWYVNIMHAAQNGTKSRCSPSKENKMSFIFTKRSLHIVASQNIIEFQCCPDLLKVSSEVDGTAVNFSSICYWWNV